MRASRDQGLAKEPFRIGASQDNDGTDYSGVDRGLAPRVRGQSPVLSDLLKLPSDIVANTTNIGTALAFSSTKATTRMAAAHIDA